MPQRVIAYIDGFNLYFGLRSKNWRRYYWLDVQKLVTRLLHPGQVLVHTKYFTSRVNSPATKRDRQNEFLEALECLTDVSIYYGKYLAHAKPCPNCGYLIVTPSEKMTDVNIATEMLVDAHQNRFDLAMVVSADSDLVGPIDAIRRLFPLKRVIAAFPPGRSSAALRHVVHGYVNIGEDKVRQCQFPEEVTKLDGHVLRRPAHWR